MCIHFSTLHAKNVATLKQNESRSFSNTSWMDFVPLFSQYEKQWMKRNVHIGTNWNPSQYFISATTNSVERPPINSRHLALSRGASNWFVGCCVLVHFLCSLFAAGNYSELASRLKASLLLLYINVIRTSAWMQFSLLKMYRFDGLRRSIGIEISFV